MSLQKSISKIQGITSSRVNHSDGLYGNTPEPSLDVEFSVQRNKDGSSQDISAQVSEILRIANEQGRKQMDVFVSKVVDANHPNARPMVEVGFKKPASKKDVKAVVEAFRSNGIDGFTMAKDSRGNVIGIRSQYIPEISARFDTVEHVDQTKTFDFAKIWITNVKKSLSAVEQIDNVSYKTPGWVSTTVYGIEEYSAAKPKDNGSTSLGDELGRRRAVLDSGQVSDGPSPVEGMDPGAGGLPTPTGDVQSAGSSSSQEVGGQRFMPAGDMASGRSVKDHGEAVDLFEKGYRLYGALYDGMEDPIRLKKVTDIEKYDPENLWAVPSKKQSRDIGIRNMPADTDYLSAVKQGDTKAAQQMVDEAAKAAAYGTNVGGFFVKNANESIGKLPTWADEIYKFGKLASENGRFETVKQYNRAASYGDAIEPKRNSVTESALRYWDGSDGTLANYIFEQGLKGEEIGPFVFAERIGNAPERGYSLNYREQTGEQGVSVLGLLDPSKGLVKKNDGTFELFNDGERRFVGGFLTPFKGSDGEPLLIGIQFDGKRHQIKSADPVTRDDSGNVIPLSQRFKATSEDIRYMPAAIQR